MSDPSVGSSGLAIKSMINASLHLSLLRTLSPADCRTLESDPVWSGRSGTTSQRFCSPLIDRLKTVVEFVLSWGFRNSSCSQWFCCCSRWGYWRLSLNDSRIDPIGRSWCCPRKVSWTLNDSGKCSISRVVDDIRPSSSGRHSAGGIALFISLPVSSTILTGVKYNLHC